MTETEALFQISNIVNGRLSFPQIVEKIALLLAREIDCKALIIEDPERPLDSFGQPYRSIYSGGGTVGKVTLCFASDHFLDALPQRLADFVGEQLGMLLARTRLAERRAQLRAEIEKIKQDLATRKMMQRAEGILIANRGMAAAVAKRWIAQQSQKTGLSTQEIADRIIAYHQATGLLEQRIA